jgi:putative DNA primase/helicase
MRQQFDTITRARGRWREILPALGVSPQFLVNRHGPCPICRKGKDRFRFDDKDGEGTYICGQCGAGNGLILLKKLHGWDHKTACDEIDKLLGDAKPLTIDAAPKVPSAERLAACQRALSDAVDSSVSAAYLARRGLGVTSPVLRGHSQCMYFEEVPNPGGKKQYKLVGRFPAVVAPIIGPDDTLQSVQRVYNADVPERKKTMPPVLTIKGAAVRLQDAAEEMGVCEGWETGLACHQMFGLPIWAALTEGGLQAFEWPKVCRKLHVFGDNDRTFVGQAAAFILAKRARQAGLEVVVHIPPAPGTDWLNVLCEQEMAAA